MCILRGTSSFSRRSSKSGARSGTRRKSRRRIRLVSLSGARVCSDLPTTLAPSGPFGTCVSPTMQPASVQSGRSFGPGKVPSRSQRVRAELRGASAISPWIRPGLHLRLNTNLRLTLGERPVCRMLSEEEQLFLVHRGGRGAEAAFRPKSSSAPEVCISSAAPKVHARYFCSVLRRGACTADLLLPNHVDRSLSPHPGPDSIRLQSPHVETTAGTSFFVVYCTHQLEDSEASIEQTNRHGPRAVSLAELTVPTRGLTPSVPCRFRKAGYAAVDR